MTAEADEMRILAVDDHPLFRSRIAALIATQAGIPMPRNPRWCGDLRFCHELRLFSRPVPHTSGVWTGNIKGAARERRLRLHSRDC